MRDNIHLFDDNINLHRIKTNPCSSMIIMYMQIPCMQSFNPSKYSFTFDIDASIVDIIIDDMFFHPDDHISTSHANALKLFKRNDNTNRYKVTRDNSLQFDLIVDLIAIDLSFR